MSDNYYYYYPYTGAYAGELLPYGTLPATSNCPPSPTPPWSRPVQSPATQTITGDDNISLTMDVTYLDSTTVGAAPYEVTLPDGNYKRQMKRIYIPGKNQATTAEFRVTSPNFVGFTSLLFNSIGTSAVLEWDGSAYHLIGGNALPEQ